VKNYDFVLVTLCKGCKGISYYREFHQITLRAKNHYKPEKAFRSPVLPKYRIILK